MMFTIILTIIIPPSPHKKKKIVFDEMITDIMTNKKRQAIREED